jgi:5-methylcytosine-specific restriction endonuclease McrA
MPVFSSQRARMEYLQAIKCELLSREPACWWCGRPLLTFDCDWWARPTIDHLTPTSRGGEDDPENLVLGCGSCNHRRSNRMPEEVILRPFRGGGMIVWTRGRKAIRRRRASSLTEDPVPVH